MICITLPNEKHRIFTAPVTVGEVARSIGNTLAKEAIAGCVFKDNTPKLVDTSYLLDCDLSLRIITANETEGLHILRHSTAHLLAYSVKELFQGVKVAIGPVIEDGFYYDFSYIRSFNSEDINAIEQKMTALAQKNEAIVREEWTRSQAIEYFESIGEDYKVKTIESIPLDETISLYRIGPFVDLCRGPHVPSTGHLKTFKLTKTAGAYWQGNSKNKMLQRIYGTAWYTQQQQQAYLSMLQEAEKRDHRKVGQVLDLFHFREQAPGLVFWHSKGWSIWQQIEQYMRGIYQEYGYQEVKGPQMLDISLWQKTGHWDNYQDYMFTAKSENQIYGLKPMSCPGHVQIFNSCLHSYRDLPIRYGEFGQCHRNEPSGALHGMMRTRGFTQDDGHVFCTEDQIQGECTSFTLLLQRVYKDFGFQEIGYKVATRPENRIGSDKSWDKAESALIESLHNTDCAFKLSPQEGAFYGPKIEYTLKDAIGRNWQCGTLQIDFSMPGRLGANYIDVNGQRRTPIMLHRAILGSLERFIGILIENYGGAMPVWLAPTQVVVCCISEASSEYAMEIVQTLRGNRFRVDADLRSEKITRKVREHSLQKVPCILIVGNKEKQERTVSVRSRGNRDLGTLTIDEFEKRLTKAVTLKYNSIL